MGNGLLPGNKLAVVPMEQSCGQADWGPGVRRVSSFQQPGKDELSNAKRPLRAGAL